MRQPTVPRGVSRTPLSRAAAKLRLKRSPAGRVWHGCMSATEAAVILSAGGALVSSQETFDRLTADNNSCTVWFHFDIPDDTAVQRMLNRIAHHRAEAKSSL